MNTKLTYFKQGQKYCINQANDDVDWIEEEQKNHYRLKIVAKENITLLDAEFSLKKHYGPSTMVFVNGYQSWTETKEYSAKENLHSLRHVPSFINKKYGLDRYGDYLFVKDEKGILHGFDYTYLREGNHVDWCGSYNIDSAFLLFFHDRKNGILRVKSDIEGRMLQKGETFSIFDCVFLSGELEEVAETYFSGFGFPKVTFSWNGYSSWYQDYQNISEEKMLRVLQGMQKEDYDLFQIDDGYEEAIGDWRQIDTKKFPQGLEPIVRKIHEKSLKAGIWVAPFVGERKSKLFQEHPDWFAKDKEGNPFYCGCNWSGFFALDFEKEEVKEYIKNCLLFLKDIGFDFFKLDFLYAVCLPSSHNQTRAEKMRGAMKWIRSILGDVKILGCGVPLSSAFGLVDACRIGGDVSLKFDDEWYMRFLHRERISTKSTLQNTIFRRHMDQWVFRNDPDVFLLRDDHIHLNQDQKEALTFLNHAFGGLYLTSDCVGQYDEEKKKILNEARKYRDAKILQVVKSGKKIEIDLQLKDQKEHWTYHISGKLERKIKE